MDVANAARVAALTQQIGIIRQALVLLEAGATISAMTLRPPEPPEALAPITAAEDAPPPEEGEEEAPPTAPPTEPDTVPPTDEAALGELTIDTTELVHPPQMLMAIRQQEVELWERAAAELERLGATGIPVPPRS